ncbi:MAG: hypothetical protein H6810_02870 [Phycisphaeraceae bacterium]|nr:MAG: hypothetical protein H6810_02870 [Phycisphaeraceae bacterium]
MRFQPFIAGVLATGAAGVLFGLGAGQDATRAGAAPDPGPAADARVAIVDPTLVRQTTEVIDPQTGFAEHAFPPTIPDRDWHREAWTRTDCLTCHETGVQNAPILRHRGLPALTLQAKCRSCHVLIPGKTEARPASARPPEVNDQFAENAFPPMIPNSPDHRGAWGKNQCLICHETGTGGAPKVEHGPQIPRLALIVQCRSCHVQVRSIETSPWDW